jgi:hypothetical protein
MVGRGQVLAVRGRQRSANQSQIRTLVFRLSGDRTADRNRVGAGWILVRALERALVAARLALPAPGGVSGQSKRASAPASAPPSPPAPTVPPAPPELVVPATPPAPPTAPAPAVAPEPPTAAVPPFPALPPFGGSPENSGLSLSGAEQATTPNAAQAATRDTRLSLIKTTSRFGHARRSAQGLRDWPCTTPSHSENSLEAWADEWSDAPSVSC